MSRSTGELASRSRWSGRPVPTPICSRSMRARCSTMAAFAPSQASRTGRRPAASSVSPPAGRTLIQVMRRVASSPSRAGGKRPTPDSVGSRSSQTVSRSAGGSISSTTPGTVSTCVSVRVSTGRYVGTRPYWVCGNGTDVSGTWTSRACVLVAAVEPPCGIVSRSRVTSGTTPRVRTCPPSRVRASSTSAGRLARTASHTAPSTVTESSSGPAPLADQETGSAT